MADHLRVFRDIANSRDRTRSNSITSAASSTGGKVGNQSHDCTFDSSSFDPQTDASTPKSFPLMRSTARNYNRWNPNKDTTDVKIDTSAIGRLFL